MQGDFLGVSIIPMINVAAVFQTLTTYCFQHLSKVPHNSYKTVCNGMLDISYWDNIQEVGKFSSRSTSAK